MKNVLVRITGALLIGATLCAAQTLATVNGNAVSEEDVQRIMAAMGARVGYQSLSPDMKKKVLDQAIEQELLKQEAIDSGIQKSEAYKEALERLKGSLALDLWMKQKLDKIQIGEKEAKAAYEEHKSSFKKPESVHARHILVKEEKEAKEIIKTLGKTSKSDLEKKFIELAKSKSTGPSGPKGGDLGEFGRAQMVKPFSDAAFALKAGEYTKVPVHTQFGYHVIYLESKNPEASMPYAEVSGRIKQMLKTEKFKEIISKTADGLREKAKVQIK